MEFSEITYLIFAFAGGIIGASLGGLNAFVLCGVSCVVGTVYGMITGDQSFNETITWGPFLSPHITFGGAVAAAAYATRKGKLDSGRNITTPLISLSDLSILMIAGSFGLLGELFLRGIEMLPAIQEYPATNSISLALILSAFVVRLVFGKAGVTGPVHGNRWKFDPTAEWSPWSLRFSQVVVLGLAFALPAAYINQALPDSTGIVFGFAAISLILFQTGAKIPVSHHIVLAAEYGTVMTGNLWWGVGFGLLASLLAEVSARLFLNHADTHIDPPAMALIVVYTLIPILTTTIL